jgi:hypothetical protein
MDINQNPTGYGAVYMIHPGSETISSIIGVKTIKCEIADIIEFNIELK